MGNLAVELERASRQLASLSVHEHYEHPGSSNQREALVAGVRGEYNTCGTCAGCGLRKSVAAQSDSQQDTRLLRTSANNKQ